MPNPADNLQNIRQLVDTFRKNQEQYLAPGYKEQRLRMDFVDKFFELLGWDISNREGAIEEFRDVVIEDNLNISGTQKYPDYTFRIGSEPVFFVETKKPSIDLKEAIGPAYQVRRYGYTAKKKISILTDFHEFAVYDTRVKPGRNDQAAVARLFYCTFEDYEKNWEFISGLLSKENVKKGSINSYIGKGQKKGSAEVDKDFLKLIEQWRGDLAKNIARNNKRTDLNTINLAIQKIIDRIIFLRICEEKGIEVYESLLNLAKGQKKIYAQLADCFIKANRKYNSELFKPNPSIDELKIDDDIFQDIITNLYYPACPYAFSVLPVEILGNIYEQFLGKTIRLTEGHQAKIEEKPEVRKAGGVYYTPKYIVDYIVKNTVGEKIKDKNPKEIDELKILDPACGSGSFLLGAYSCLLDYHLAYYTKKDRRAKALKDGKIWQAGENSYRLTITEKQNILLNNIFGVDIDAQAAEVTKLSLMLKLLEGEGDESAGKLFKYSDLKLLPTLSNNIKCGNSLIGPDFYKDKNLSLFDSEDMKKINVFDWNDKEKGFGEIMARGGFDVVIGNPPYVKARDYNPDKEYYRDYINNCKKYQTLYKMWDLYIPFVEKGICLLRQKGLFGMIVPDTIGKSDYASLLREWILSDYHIKQIDFFPDSKIFESQKKIVGIKNIIIIVSSEKNPEKARRIFHSKDFTQVNHEELAQNNKDIFTQNLLESGICPKKTKPLGEICFASYGLRLNSDKNDKKFKFKKSDLLAANKTAKNSRQFVEGKNLSRYTIKKHAWLEWGTERCPNRLVRPTFPEMYEPQKILLGRQTKVAALDNDHSIVDNTIIVCMPFRSLHGVNNKNIQKYFANIKMSRAKLEETSKDYKLSFLLGVINSKFIRFYIKGLIQNGIDMFPDDWKKIPIPQINFSDQNEKKQHDKFVGLVTQMLAAQKQFHSAKSESDKKHYQQKIDLLDKQIDALVYELYGLTEEEIKVVEGSLK